MNAEPARKGVNPIIKAWVAFHCTIILLWSLPAPTPETASLASTNLGAALLKNPVDGLLAVNGMWKQPPLTNYLSSTGLWQYWDMFAPNPTNLDIWLDARVTLQDGSSFIHEYPRMKTLDLYHKYLMERYRKYVERLNGDEYEYRWPKTCQRIALEEYHNPANPPVKVELRRHWRIIQPPDKQTPETYNEYTFWTQQIDQDQLKREAAE